MKKKRAYSAKTENITAQSCLLLNIFIFIQLKREPPTQGRKRNKDFLSMEDPAMWSHPFDSRIGTFGLKYRYFSKYRPIPISLPTVMLYPSTTMLKDLKQFINLPQHKCFLHWRMWEVSFGQLNCQSHEYIYVWFSDGLYIRNMPDTATCNYQLCYIFPLKYLVCANKCTHKKISSLQWNVSNMKYRKGNLDQAPSKPKGLWIHKCSCCIYCIAWEEKNISNIIMQYQIRIHHHGFRVIFLLCSVKGRRKRMKASRE